MSESKQMIGFVVGESSFASPITSVHEIVRVPDITPVPDSPAHLIGVMNLRGRIISVLDLRLGLGLPASDRTRHSRIIVAKAAGTTVGLLVDSASDVLRISAAQVESPATLFPAGHATYVTGLAKLEDRLVVLVDLGLLLEQTIASAGRLRGTQPASATQTTGTMSATPGAR